MQNYNILEKFLHDLVLSKKFINKSLYELEKIIYMQKRDIKDQPHIFITGMPRSGTTSLLNFLFFSNEYASLTYKNMPFILSPNLSKFFNNKDILPKERLHGDGIKIDNNSPEALDEIFFNNDKEFVKNELINFIQLTLTSKNKKKYLSKNNLNYKRISLIRSILPNSIFLISIREPLQHAYSLLKQHNKFSQLQKKDDFIRRYMNYLGHNEFGLDHKPWNDPIYFSDFNSINYWLEQWHLFYRYIYDKFNSCENCHFIVYEKLNNLNYIEKILNKINLHKRKNVDLFFFKNSNKEKIELKYDNNNLNKSILIYKKFFEFSN